MCKEDSWMFQVSNLGSAVVETLEHREWSVQLPQQLQDRGPCTVTLVSGRIQGMNTYDGLSKIFVQSNIPIQGCSTEIMAGSGSTGYNQLFEGKISYTPVYAHWSVEPGATFFADSTTTSPIVHNSPLDVRVSAALQCRADSYSFRCGGLPSHIHFRGLVLLSSVNPLDTLNYTTLYDYNNATAPQIEFHLSIVFDRDRAKE